MHRTEVSLSSRKLMLEAALEPSSSVSRVSGGGFSKGWGSFGRKTPWGSGNVPGVPKDCASVLVKGKPIYWVSFEEGRRPYNVQDVFFPPSLYPNSILAGLTF